MYQKIISWDDLALFVFKTQIEFIGEDSQINAERVLVNIEKRLNKVAIYPESCTPDKYKS